MYSGAAEGAVSTVTFEGNVSFALERLQATWGLGKARVAAARRIGTIDARASIVEEIKEESKGGAREANVVKTRKVMQQ